jgi:hypothetical protein
MEREQTPGLPGSVAPFGTGGNTPPWQGFAHPEHRPEEYEALLRTLRFALIQLNKFWVELNAFPVFMNEMKGASLNRIERLFTWLMDSPNWTEAVPHPRLIPDLRQPALRKALLELATCVRRARELRAAMQELQDGAVPDMAALVSAQGHLGIALALSRQLGLERGTQIDVQMRIAETATRLARNRRVRKFFGRLATDCAMPEALNLMDAGRIFQTVDHLRKTKPEVLTWRKPQLIGPQQKVRIESWQDRVRPMFEARKRLRELFKSEMLDKSDSISAERLRAIAAALREGGTFRMFNSSYKEAFRHYLELLKPELAAAKGSVTKEAPEAMAARLEEWAGLSEHKAQFEANAEARAFFAPFFRGIDTDFQLAVAVNTWATGLRAELKIQDPGSPEGARDLVFCNRLLEWAFTASDLQLHAAVALCEGDEARTVQGSLLENEYAQGREFADLGNDEEARLLEATRLRDAIKGLMLKPAFGLERLTELRQLVEERLSLLQRMEGALDARASLKTLYLGEDTNLAPIDGATAYGEYIESAGLPEALRQSFLTAYGPSRLNDTRKMVSPARNGLAGVKDHLGRLEAATHGQSRRLEDEPLLDLITRIQRALKHPTQLGEMVDQLRAEGHWRQ